MEDDNSGMNVSGQNILLPQDLSKTTRVLIDFKPVPEEVKRTFWEIFNNNLAFTFIDSHHDENILRRDVQISMIDFLATINHDSFDWNLSRVLNQVRFEADKSIMRAKGTQKKVWNERSLIATQISEGIQTSNNKPTQGHKKVLGIF